MTADVQPVRGSNPEPDAGWPWYLTDYEISYVQVFNARPPRSGWVASERDEARLDDEAAGVRAGSAPRIGSTALDAPSTPAPAVPPPRSTGFSVATTLIVVAPLLIVGLVAVLFGWQILEGLQPLTASNEELRDSIDNLQRLIG